MEVQVPPHLDLPSLGRSEYLLAPQARSASQGSLHPAISQQYPVPHVTRPPTLNFVPWFHFHLHHPIQRQTYQDLWLGDSCLPSSALQNCSSSLHFAQNQWRLRCGVKHCLLRRAT